MHLNYRSVWDLVSWKHKRHSNSSTPFDWCMLFCKTQTLEVYFSFFLRDFINLFLYYPTGSGSLVHSFYDSSLNGFKFLCLEAAPWGNRGLISSGCELVCALLPRTKAVHIPALLSSMAF